MTIQQCVYVLEIAKTGSFNEAAKRLFVAQSSLSVSVKSLEQELHIQIFTRTANGVYLTEDGTAFVRYAQQLVAQSDLIVKHFTTGAAACNLYVATQHYDFVADVFAKLLAQTNESHYRFSLQERKTYDVIDLTVRGYSDIGVIAMKGSDRSIMERYLNGKGLSFTPMKTVKPHVYLRRGHPLANISPIQPVDLKDYPCLSYEQGEHSASFFAEEIGNVNTDRQVHISDRASLMNVLLATDGYTIGTGMMPSELNFGRVVSISYQSEEYYILGYLLRQEKEKSDLLQKFIDMLRESAEETPCDLLNDKIFNQTT